MKVVARLNFNLRILSKPDHLLNSMIRGRSRFKFIILVLLDLFRNFFKVQHFRYHVDISKQINPIPGLLPKYFGMALRQTNIFMQIPASLNVAVFDHSFGFIRTPLSLADSLELLANRGVFRSRPNRKQIRLAVMKVLEASELNGGNSGAVFSKAVISQLILNLAGELKVDILFLNLTEHFLLDLHIQSLTVVIPGGSCNAKT